MTTAAFLGAMFGAGVLVLWRGFKPTPAPLRASLAGVGEATTEPDGIFEQLGARALRAAQSLGLSVGQAGSDLVLTNRTRARHLGEKLGLGVLGVCLVPATAAVMALGGVHLPVGVPLWGSLALGIMLFFAPDIGIKGEARRRRDEFRHDLGSFLDLVVIGLAGGAGVESALEEAASATPGLAGRRISAALANARFHGETPWRVLASLGENLKVAELAELASSVGLAGTEGAKVRQSLDAKAASLRSHLLSEAEAEAQAASERMSLPVVVLFMGFLIFIGYPAVSRVLTGL